MSFTLCKDLSIFQLPFDPMQPFIMVLIYFFFLTSSPHHPPRPVPSPPPLTAFFLLSFSHSNFFFPLSFSLAPLGCIFYGQTDFTKLKCRQFFFLSLADFSLQCIKTTATIEGMKILFLFKESLIKLTSMCHMFQNSFFFGKLCNISSRCKSSLTAMNVEFPGLWCGQVVVVVLQLNRPHSVSVIPRPLSLFSCFSFFLGLFFSYMPVYL